MTQTNPDNLDYEGQDGTEEAIAAIQQEADLEFATASRPGNTMSYAEKRALLEALLEYDRRQEFGGHLRYFPMDGPLNYLMYPRHVKVMQLSAVKRVRMFMAGNRVGKTLTGGFEFASYLTGDYPEWWEGWRWDHPTDIWVSGDTSQTTRDIIQTTLLGEPGNWGTGMIAKDNILLDSMRMRPGAAGGVDTVRIKSRFGGESKLGFKSYDQRRRGFNGVGKHGIWLDEEPPMEVYSECVMRTMTTNGRILITFTPLMGITPFVQKFLDNARETGDIPY